MLWGSLIGFKSLSVFAVLGGGGCGCLVTRSCRALWDPTGCNPPWDSPGKNTGVGAISFSRGSSRPRDRTRVSCIAGRFFTTEPPGNARLAAGLTPGHHMRLLRKHSPAQRGSSAVSLAALPLAEPRPSCVSQCSALPLH